MTPLTARLVEPGASFYNGRRLQTIPSRHVGVHCEACEWHVRVPLRFGRDWAERLRRQHLGRVHFSDLVSGHVVMDPELVDLLGAK